MTQRKQPKGRYYRGCYLEPNHTARFTGTHWRWASWVEGVGGVYANSLADIKELVRDALAEQGLRKQA